MRHVTKKPVKWRMSPSHKKGKQNSFQYSFVASNSTIHVCKVFFLHTLAISEQTVLTTFSKLLGNGHLQPEKRSLPRSRKLSTQVRSDICDHINKFSTVESHYCRKSSRKMYLPQELSLSEMYRLYTQECSVSGKQPAKQWVYNDVFHREFNLGFHKPKKDQSTKYQRLDESERSNLYESMEKHQLNKNLARELESQLKEQAKTDEHINVACFDLQQVLLTPHSMSSQLFYGRKLSTFNLTVYDIGTKSVSYTHLTLPTNREV